MNKIIKFFKDCQYAKLTMYKNILLLVMCISSSFCILQHFNFNLSLLVMGIFMLIFSLILFITSLFSLKFCASKTKSFFISVVVYSFSISTALMLQNKINYSGSAGDSYIVNNFTDLVFNDVLIIFALFFAIANLNIILIKTLEKITMNIFTKKKIARKKTTIPNKLFILICALLLIIPWSVFWLTYYPGVSFVDTYYILSNPIALSVQHPFFYNMLMYSLVLLGFNIFGSVNNGIALYSIIQMLFVASTVTFCIVWIRKRGCPTIYLFMVLAYFALSPFFASTTTYITKDVFFSAAILLYIPLLYELYESKWLLINNMLFLLKISALSIFIIFIRNNGPYVVTFIIISILIFYCKDYKKIPLSLAIFVFAGLIFPISITNTVMKNVVKRDPLFQESVAIPLQQIAITVVDENGRIPVEAENFIYSIYPRESFTQQYAPMTVDMLKWSSNPYAAQGRSFLQYNQKEFLNIWLKLMPKNLPLYVKAYLMQTYGFWKLSTTNNYTLPENPLIMEEIGIQQQQIFENHLQSFLQRFYSSTYFVMSEGNMFWMIFYLSILVIIFKTSGKFIVFVPVLAIWCTLMVSTPVAFSIRYVYSFAYTIPFLIYITLFELNNNIEKVGKKNKNTHTINHHKKKHRMNNHFKNKQKANNASGKK